MTAKIDGTNGLLQSYDYQVPVTGFTYTFAAGTQVLVMNPAGTLATGTITMPALPADGMTITFSSSQQITALTMAGNGATVSNGITALAAGQAMAYIYRAASTTWFPYVAVPYVAPSPGSQLVSGTAVTLTTQTSVDFTGIPSWVKRVTVMFNAVSLSSTTPDFYIQLGYGATPTFETTGYTENSAQINSAGTAAFNGNLSTAFFFQRALAAITDTFSGIIVLTNVSGNIWAQSGNITRNGNNLVTMSAGVKTISGGALSAVRVLHSGTTETFDAGSINILYE